MHSPIKIGPHHNAQTLSCAHKVRHAVQAARPTAEVTASKWPSLPLALGRGIDHYPARHVRRSPAGSIPHRCPRLRRNLMQGKAPQNPEGCCTEFLWRPPDLPSVLLSVECNDATRMSGCPQTQLGWLLRQWRRCLAKPSRYLLSYNIQLCELFQFERQGILLGSHR